MKAIVYRITLLEPALVTALDGDPNSAVAHDFLPGSVLRGAMVGRYLRLRRSAALDAADREARRLFFDGSTRFLNGYPVPDGGGRTLPTPLSWHREKGTRDPIRDFAWGDGPDLVRKDGEQTNWELVREPFCRPVQGDEDEVRLERPRRRVSVHIKTDARRGRPTKEAGEIYRYDALAGGQTFEAAVLCDGDADGDLVRELLADGEVHMGGSVSAGYGRVHIGSVRDVGDKWREAGGPLLPAPDGRLVVTLLSDVLLRNKYGQFVAEAEVLTQALSVALGVSLMPVNGGVFAGFRTVGGFNRKWGLPLPQALALRMGSVFVYQAPGCDPKRLTALEWQGIGERRAEGFGRLAFNWHQASEWRVRPDDRRVSKEPVAIPAGTAGHDLARRMVERMFRQRLDRALAAQAQALVKGASCWPHRSQLGRLRAVVDDALPRSPEEGRQRLEDFIKSVAKRQTARRQFEHCRVGGEALLAWLRSRVAEEAPEGIWRYLIDDTGTAPRIGDVSADRSPELAWEYTLRLIREVAVLGARAKGGEDR